MAPQRTEILQQPIVFISYSHDSDDHRERVLELSERLRGDGVVTILDRYVDGLSAEGLARWMMNALTSATRVLCVCTETYCKSFLGQEIANKGKGVDWEGILITQAIYESRSRSNKFIPVLFAHSDKSHIPEPLRSRIHYIIDCEAGYQALYDTLLDQGGVEPGGIGELKRKPRATGQPLIFGENTGAAGAFTRQNGEPPESLTAKMLSKAGDPEISTIRLNTRLNNDLERLNISNEIRQNAFMVLTRPEYPRWMSISGSLLENPIWARVPTRIRRFLIDKYPVDGLSAPKIMHLDMLLIRGNDAQGHGQIFTYFSPRWQTNLITFRQRLPEDNPDRRQQMNAAHLANFLPVPSESILVTSIPNKYAVSVKRDEHYGDLKVYIYEFCSVVFTETPNSLTLERPKVHNKNGNQGPWFYLQTLLNNNKSLTVNGDVIRALHESFSVTLGSVPTSVPDGFIQVRGE